MKDDINFLHDDTLLEKEKLQEIMKEVSKKPKKYNPNSLFLRKFVLAMFKAAEKQTKKKKPSKEEKYEKKLKKSVLEEVPGPKIEKEVETKTKPEKVEPAPIPEYPEYPVIRNSDNTVLARAALKDHNYIVSEPKLSETEGNLLEKLKGKIGKKISSKPKLVHDDKLMKKNIDKFAKKFNVKPNKELYRKMHYYLVKDLIDYGKINVPLKDNNVKEIHCKSYKEPVKVKYNNFDDVKTDIKFENHEELQNLLKRMFEKAKVKLNKKNNYLDTDKLGFQIKATYDFEGEASKFEIKKLNK